MTENEQKAVQLVAEADKKLNSKGNSFAIKTPPLAQGKLCRELQFESGIKLVL